MELQKTNFPGLMKDKRTNMIINTNTAEYDRILAQRAKEKSSKDQINSLADRMNIVEKNLEEIKSLLIKALGKND